GARSRGGSLRELEDRRELLAVEGDDVRLATQLPDPGSLQPGKITLGVVAPGVFAAGRTRSQHEAQGRGHAQRLQSRFHPVLLGRTRSGRKIHLVSPGW